MKLKNYWKRFWTLDRHHAAGFTLVELIVVIAILAILAGVGIPVYSGYITKANKQADMTLISDAAHALQLHYYNGNTEGSGYVILYPEETPAEADSVFGVPAMEAAFGSNWESASFLKYGGWINGGMTNVALNQALYGVAGSVGSSAYITGSTPEELLTNVTDLTYTATGLFKTMDPGIKYSTITNQLFNGDATVLEEYCNEFGITTKVENGVTQFADDVTDDQLSNLLVFGAAHQITNGTDTSVTGLVFQYAGYASFVNAQTDPQKAQAAKTAYDKLNADLCKDLDGDGKVNSTDIGMAFEGFANDPSIKSDFSAYQQGSQFENDMTAFVCIMEAVNEASGTVTPEEMMDKDFFTGNKVSDFFDTYISATDAMSKLSEAELLALQNAAAKGGVIVFLHSGPVLDCSADGALAQ